MLTHLAALIIPIATALTTRAAALHWLNPARRHRAATRRNGTILTRPPTTEGAYDYPTWAYRAALTIRAHLTRNGGR